MLSGGGNVPRMSLSSPCLYLFPRNLPREHFTFEAISHMMYTVGSAWTLGPGVHRLQVGTRNGRFFTPQRWLTILRAVVGRPGLPVFIGFLPVVCPVHLTLATRCRSALALANLTRRTASDSSSIIPWEHTHHCGGPEHGFACGRPSATPGKGTGRG